ncbi:MAG: hypothetical protein KU37_09470 [Sulfuricurvum sp. PC08-66]|nr:MAG: hypothetical protein KU37_09470 [Sulfuricurvum sp. PC08-66]
MQLFFAVVLGGLFGYIMHRAGIANPDRIINMLRLKDFHLMKVIFFGVGFSSLVVMLFLWWGILEPQHLQIKPAYFGVLLGGALFGLGFAISGYCPGTCLVGAGAQRYDALIFLAGGLVGALAFTFSYEYLAATWLFSDIAGKTTVTDHYVTTSIVDASYSIAVNGAIALLFFLLAWKLPNKPRA